MDPRKPAKRKREDESDGATAISSSTIFHAIASGDLSDALKTILLRRKDLLEEKYRAASGLFSLLHHFEDALTPLKLAIEANQPDIAAWLINEAKASVDGGDGVSPLIYAIAYGQEQVVAALLEAKASLTPSLPESAKSFLEKHILERSLDQKGSPSKNIVTIHAIGVHWLKFSSLESLSLPLLMHMATPLTCASWKGNPGIVKQLLQAKAPIEAKDYIGSTALDTAVIEGHRDIVQMLLESKASTHKTQPLKFFPYWDIWEQKPLFISMYKEHRAKSPRTSGEEREQLLLKPWYAEVLKLNPRLTKSYSLLDIPELLGHDDGIKELLLQAQRKEEVHSALLFARRIRGDKRDITTDADKDKALEGSTSSGLQLGPK